MTCYEALKFKEGPDKRVIDEKQKEILFGMILSQAKSVAKFKVKDNLAWAFKKNCDVRLMKLCKDS